MHTTLRDHKLCTSAHLSLQIWAVAEGAPMLLSDAVCLAGLDKFNDR